MLVYVLLILGFGLLFKGADCLVEGASSLAKRLRVSDLIVGLTVVAFGTSTPELFVNIFASLNGKSEIAIGNILGSNIVNVLLILGIASIIFPLRVTRNTVWREIPLSLLAGVLVWVLANDYYADQLDFSGMSRLDGLILIFFFILFMYYILNIAKKERQESQGVGDKQVSLGRSLALVLSGLLALILGGKWVLEGAVQLAVRFKASESLVGLTIVAIGTSLPELATSVVAVFKKNADIAVGNVVGSNIFNVFFILGVSAVIKPLPFRQSNNMDVGVAILASGILFIFMFTGKKRFIDRGEGILLVLSYVVYLVLLMIRG
ncbi:MAG: calcium/sodium antiporter [Candidatus Omnitrophota bacterium]